MRYIFILSLLALASCGNNPEKAREQTEDVLEVATAVSTNTPDTLCFMRTEGLKNEDTAAVRLVINNGLVEGKMMYLPFESDWRLGNISGKKDGRMINATWKYMQEGMVDSIQVSFKMEGDHLVQKAPSYDPKTGREFLSDTSKYSQSYQKISCDKFPRYDFDLGIK